MTLLIPKGRKRRLIKRRPIKRRRIERDEKAFLIPKAKIIRAPKWLDVVRTMPCVITGARPVVPAHIRWNSDGGTALKPSDDRVVPLTDEMHKLQHQIGELTFWSDRFKKAEFRNSAMKAWALSRPDSQDMPELYEHFIMECIVAWAKRQHNLFVKNGAPEWL